MIQETWRDLKLDYSDKDKKVLGDKPTTNNDGCDFDERVYRGDEVMSTFNYKPTPENREGVAQNGEVTDFTAFIFTDWQQINDSKLKLDAF